LGLYRGNYFQVDTGGWSPDPDAEACIFRPASGDAELQVDVYDYGTDSTWQLLLEQGRRRAPSGTRLEEVSCGQFVGITYEYTDTDGSYCREWLLGLAELVLFVTYCCALEQQARDKEAVNRILSTLADARP